VSSPILSGQSIVYALVVSQHAGVSPLQAVAGDAAVSGGETPPSDAIISAVPDLTGARWQRFAHVTVRRQGNAVFVTARPTPRFCITRCDDFRDYALAFGEPPDDGTLLGPSVRAFFANGGRRCWVATLRRPDFEDHDELARVRDDMIGIPGSGETEATGLERLLLVPAVTVVDVPDLCAARGSGVRSFRFRRAAQACFLPCDEFPPKGIATSNERTPAWTPIFDSGPVFTGDCLNEVFDTQVRLLARCVVERWRVLLLLSVPRLPDGGSGPYVPPTEGDARAWVKQFDVSVKQTVAGAPSVGDTESVSCAALYWPWVLYQERVDAPVLEMPPSAYAAAIIARRDLTRGPQISPANETLREVVGLTAAFGDDVHGRLYDPDPDKTGPVCAVNVALVSGYGIWCGARVLSTEPYPDSFRSAALTAIELRMRRRWSCWSGRTVRRQLQSADCLRHRHSSRGAAQAAREAFSCADSPHQSARRLPGRAADQVGVAVAAPASHRVPWVGARA
jgi:hypothetical protein